jgi:pyridinium-3,5-biscarboxylic acid mononucleotide synthase
VNAKALTELLEAVREGKTSTEEALTRLRDLPFADLGFAKVDKHRALRVGFPEVIYGAGKTFEQIVAIAGALGTDSGPILVTRVDPAQGERLAQALGGVFHPVPRAVVVQRGPIEDRGRGEVLIVAAGTSDLPVAEEARLTAELMGNRTRLITDVGVAGLHRILAQRPDLDRAEVIVVVAGMEGALPSVVAGLTSRPVIAVPTSVGYGASFGGLAPLLGMLNSCAAGVVVVNIDNGFGAGYAASLYNRRREEPR